MKSTGSSDGQEGIKALTESEIQERLYGPYLGRRKKGEASPAAFVPEPSEWTGSEILSAELSRLRKELISLRTEKEHLWKEFSQRKKEPPAFLSGRRGGFWGGLAVVALFLCIGAPVGSRFLQASPGGMEPAPFTIQVAVYDLKAPAERALALLEELGYPAFLVETQRSNGTSRYRIYVGRFVTKLEAEQHKDRLIQDSRFSDAFVRVQ